MKCNLDAAKNSIIYHYNNGLAKVDLATSSGQLIKQYSYYYIYNSSILFIAIN